MTQTRDLDITGPSLSWQELMNKETATTSDAPLPFPRHIPLQLTAVALTLSCFRRRRAVDRWSAGVVRSDYITHLFPWGTSGYTSHNFHSAEAQGKQESNGFEEFVRQGALVIWGPAEIFTASVKTRHLFQLLILLRIYISLIIWLFQVLAAACGTFSCGKWDLFPWPGIEPGPPALGAWSLSHWTTREVPVDTF